MTQAPAHILVASDLSARSDRALARGFRLATALDARVTVTSVIDDAMPPQLARQVADSTRSTLTAQAEQAGDGRPFEVETRIGHPASDVLAVIDDLRPDLVLLGSHRDRGFLANLRETTAQRIVRLTAHPVLIAAAPVDRDYHRILAAVDFSPASTAALRLGHGIAPDARITPVHALHVPYPGMMGASRDTRSTLEASFRAEATALARSWSDTSPLPDAAMDEIVIEAGSPYAVLQTLARSAEAGLVTVGAHGRVGAAPAILGSLASDLIRQPFCDVLVARPAPAAKP